jgi:membrane associated rhomboid family serine protease
MDHTLAFVLATLTVTMLAVTLHAWRLRNERRDVALLGAIGGLFGVGTAVAVAVL